MTTKLKAVGIKVIVDLVPNHASTDHEWFQAALASPSGSPERARFHFIKGRCLHSYSITRPPHSLTTRQRSGRITASERLAISLRWSLMDPLLSHIRRVVSPHIRQIPARLQLDQPGRYYRLRKDSAVLGRPRRGWIQGRCSRRLCQGSERGAAGEEVGDVEAVEAGHEPRRRGKARSSVV